MIIFSRNRTETTLDTELAETIATHFHVHVLSIPFFYDLRSFGATIQRLRTLNEPCLFLAPFPERATKSLLVHLEIKKITVALDISNTNSDQILKFIEEADDLFLISETSGGYVERLDELTVKRWYPVIDQSECIGCLECINFCLFGVYVIGGDGKPVTDQPDACRDGCPACARVCPGAAVMFPMHDDPDISGRTDAQTIRQKVRIDLSQTKEEHRHQKQPDQSNKWNRLEPDELDDWVDQIDRFDYRQF
ncbi:MAG: ferredoxin family protein [Planctomycetaceae bacterium]|jgi:NAD-dependent dihydropyrimidine dehydrogenase PreA subunit|nr:ferredoxin family protein [Planctomycetaceae bacterium]